MFSFRDRAKVFNTGRSLSPELGNLAQNEMPVRETDIILEFQNVDYLIERLLQYKRILVSELQQTY